MTKFCLSRFVAAALIAVSGAALVTASFDAEARRAGGGSSVGRQSSNVTQQRQATTPPAAANNTAGATAAPAAAGAATAGAAGAAAKSGASRWLGPIAGIAAGLGIAALLSSMGLSGAFAEFLGSALLIAAVVFAVMFIIRRLRGAGPRTATQGAFNGANNAPGQQQQPMWREALKPTAAAAPAAAAAAPVAPPAVLPKAGEDNNWFVPGDFDTPAFLKQAKEQFVRIQAVWDSGSTDGLRDFLTDDLITELKPQLAERGAAPNKTEVVLLNAEMLGIETVSDGHLASVRFSGMLREAPGAEAFRFEEVWNLFKPANGGWLLAGIQQIPVDLAS
ncbi:Tim44 domain-containing protein [Achromobacter sp. LC458]|uniref:Tim44 domain-containing protein n=1 Tax=Achromobacter spanius TaxID=217203 RepID=A0A2S5GMK5_9BURK|nr:MULTISPECIES: TIM44-like domain-containing protein [Achromobacter]AYD62825.1 Tim44 domain-containing protein [Achromobacter sp. B7]PPA74208.1 Tim44 domain-containing protein [Achromobacter spanius]QYJ22085.1 39S ribosomal protein L45 [Achromobacter sp. ES-001]TRM49637.1 Tim44 domain-containing protein [Achromobacter sp. LC458]